MFSRRSFLKVAGRASLALAGLGAYGFGFEPRYRLNVTRYAFTPPRWTPGLKLRVAVLTDVHAGAYPMPVARVEELVATANALAPDVTVLLGDYVTAWSRDLKRDATACAGALAALRAPLGVHAILGNHDWWDDRAAQRRRGGPLIVRDALAAAGIPAMENQAIRLEKQGTGFWLLGLGDQIAFPYRYGFIGVDDLPATLALIKDEAPAILLAHEPDIFPHVPERISLTLSGHTHGGQVRLFGWSPIVPSQYNNRYAYGHVVEEGRHLIVSSGLGTARLPVRLGVPPEIVLLDLG